MKPIPLPDDADIDEFVRQNPDGAIQETVAAALGVTRQRVAQIENKAISKLKILFRSRGWSFRDMI